MVAAPSPPPPPPHAASSVKAPTAKLERNGHRRPSRCSAPDGCAHKLAPIAVLAQHGICRPGAKPCHGASFLGGRMLEKMRKLWGTYGPYERFERVSLRFIQFLLALITVYAIALVCITLVRDVTLGAGFMD